MKDTFRSGRSRVCGSMQGAEQPIVSLRVIDTLQSDTLHKFQYGLYAEFEAFDCIRNWYDGSLRGTGKWMTWPMPYCRPCKDAIRDVIEDDGPA